MSRRAAPDRDRRAFQRQEPILAIAGYVQVPAAKTRVSVGCQRAEGSPKATNQRDPHRACGFSARRFGTAGGTPEWRHAHEKTIDDEKRRLDRH